jgi:hypothetical protein
MRMAETEVFWDGCVLGKALWKPFTPRSDRSQMVGRLIHADFNGPMSVRSFKGAKYFLGFKDHYNNYRRLFFIERKNEFSKCLRTSQNELSTAAHTLKTFLCDGRISDTVQTVCELQFLLNHFAIESL